MWEVGKRGVHYRNFDGESKLTVAEERSVFKAAENRKSPKTCGNRKIKKNMAEIKKKQFFSAESRKRTPYYPPSLLHLCGDLYFYMGCFCVARLHYLGLFIFYSNPFQWSHDSE